MSQPRGLTILNWSTKMIKPSSRCSTRVVSGPEIMYRRGRGYAPASLALVSHSHGILLHDWGASRQSTRLRPMLLSSRPQPGSTSISVCVCVTKCSSHQGLLFHVSASLTLVAHIHTPPLHEKGVGAFRTCLLYTSPSPRDYAASRMPSSA